MRRCAGARLTDALLHSPDRSTAMYCRSRLRAAVNSAGAVDATA
jgi:hypothetical protein